MSISAFALSKSTSMLLGESGTVQKTPFSVIPDPLKTSSQTNPEAPR